MFCIDNCSKKELTYEEMLEIVLVAMNHDVNKNHTVQVLNTFKGMFIVSQNDIGYIIFSSKEN
jgi:hypothetical protein